MTAFCILDFVLAIGRANRKKIVCLVLGALLFALCVTVEAQQPRKIPKVGWLFLRPAESSYGMDLTLQALRDLGYADGKNIIFELRHGDNKPERLPVLAEELVRLKMDVILAASVNAAQTAKNATKTIPVVFVSTADPVAAGLVDSLARPGGNLTGFTTIAPLHSC